MARTKSDLIEQLAARHDIPRRVAEEVVDQVFEGITAQLAVGGRVEVRGFGTLSTRSYAPRQARNPKTQRVQDVPERVLPRFKPSRMLLSDLNQHLETT